MFYFSYIREGCASGYAGSRYFKWNDFLLHIWISRVIWKGLSSNFLNLCLNPTGPLRVFQFLLIIFWFTTAIHLSQKILTIWQWKSSIFISKRYLPIYRVSIIHHPFDKFKLSRTAFIYNLYLSIQFWCTTLSICHSHWGIRL